jgi:hypothetical protein
MIFDLLMNAIGALMCCWSVMDLLLALHIGTPPKSYNPSLTNDSYIAMASLEALVAGVALKLGNKRWE